MRRTMHSLFVLAIIATPALAQSDAQPASGCAVGSCPSQGCGTIPTPMSGCGNGTASQLAAYMNAFPTHPNLWGSYAADYNARTEHLFRHVNNCNCLDPKRNLHSHPSVIYSGSAPCTTQVCETGEVKPSLVQRIRLQSEGMISQLKSPWSPRPLVGQPAVEQTVQQAGQPIVQQIAQPVAPQVDQPVVSQVVAQPESQSAQGASSGITTIQLR